MPMISINRTTSTAANQNMGRRKSGVMCVRLPLTGVRGGTEEPELLPVWLLDGCLGSLKVKKPVDLSCWPSMALERELKHIKEGIRQISANYNQNTANTIGFRAIGITK